MKLAHFIAKAAPLTLVLFVGLSGVAFAQGTTDADIVSRIDTGIRELLWAIVVNVFGLFAALGGMVFDYGIETFVIGFGTVFKTGGFGQGVDTLWIYIRDLFNLLFIFGLVWLGLKMILNSGGADTKRWLGTLILAALLVNFSLYIVKFIIDFTNIIAINILNASQFAATGKTYSENFLDIIGLTSIFNMKGATLDGATNAIILGNGGYGYIFGSAIFLIIAAFVFAAGGILLIIRFAVLMIYMVFSPLMFIGWVLPQFASVQKKYWSGFLSRAFYAPVYVFLIYFSFFVLERYFFLTVDQSKQSFAAMSGGSQGTTFESTFADTFIPFVLACIFLIASIIVAQKLSIEGGGQAVRMFGQYRRKVPVVLSRYSGAGWGARTASNAAGRGVNSGMSRIQARAQSIDTEAYRNKYRQGANRLFGQNSRASRAVGAAAAGVAGAAKGVGTSTTIDRTARSGAKALQDTKYGMTNTEAQDKREKGVLVDRAEKANNVDRGVTAREELRNKKRDDSYQFATTGRIYDPKTKQMKDRSELSQEEIKQTLESQEAEMQSTVTNYSGAQLEEMIQQEPERLRAIVGDLKPGQFDKVLDSDSIDQATKNKLYGARQDAIKSTLTDTLEKDGTIMTEKLQNLGKQQLETLGDDFIRENADALSQTQIDDLKKSDNFTQAQKGAFIAARKRLQKEKAETGNYDALFNNTEYDNKTQTQVLKPRKPVEVANITFDAFEKTPGGPLREEMVKRLRGSDLEQIYNKGTMNAEQRARIAQAVRADKANPANDYLDSPNGQRNWGGKTSKTNTGGSSSTNPFDKFAQPDQYYDWEEKNK